MAIGSGLGSALMFWGFTLGPLAALLVAFVASVRIIYRLGEKWLLLIIRSVESTIRDAKETEEYRTDATTVVTDAVEDLRMGYPGARLETDLPDQLPVRANDSLAIAVEQVVENGIVHNEDPTPEVRVTAEEVDPDAEWIELRIADDGPGLPDHERSVVIEGGQITALEHGSGLGLWVAVWTVQAYGGKVDVVDRDTLGTTITFRLKRAQEAFPEIPVPG